MAGATAAAAAAAAAVSSKENQWEPPAPALDGGFLSTPSPIDSIRRHVMWSHVMTTQQDTEWRI